MTTQPLRVSLPATGFESPLSDAEHAIQESARIFAQTVLEPLGTQLDKLSAVDAIASGSPYWQVFSKFGELGISIGDLLQLPPDERGRLTPIIFEELGAGDGGLAISLGASLLPWLMIYATGRTDLLVRYPEGSAIGCWGITEPDHGSDALDFGRMCAQPGTQYGRPNCTVRSDGNDFVVTGQKSAWVSNGTVAQLSVLFAAFDDGSGEAKHCVVLVPLSADGVTRGKPLEKLGQRALPQGELYFDDVRIPGDHMLAAPGDAYERAVYTIVSEANALVGSIWVGAARKAYEHALDYAHTRKQGGVQIIRHQNVRYRLFHMMRRVEMARALNRRVHLFNANAPLPAVQGSIATKITSTQTAFEIASEAIQMLGGNGVTREYPVEKLMRDARASMIEDGCNEMLAIKGGAYLEDPERNQRKFSRRATLFEK